MGARGGRGGTGVPDLNGGYMNIVQEYFDAFCKKDLNKLSELYHDDVILNEWGENIFCGKDMVLEANKKLFDSVGQINIQVLSSGITDTRHINEIIVELDNKIVSVVDMIRVDNGKIEEIMAYRGF